MNILNREVNTFTEKPSGLWQQSAKPQTFKVHRVSLQT